jgi:hypothetical protein
MIVTISQPRYLPWAGYLHRVAASDVFVYLDNVQYTPRDWENRNQIKSDRGRTWLTVPVKARYLAPILDVTIDNEQDWQHRHWRSLCTFYGSAPYFRTYASRFEPAYRERTWERLIDLNLALTAILCDCFGLWGPRFVRATELSVAGKGSDLLLRQCQELGATVYLSGSQGRNYLDEAAFAAANIRVVYQEYRHPVYPQPFGPFEPNLAALDLLFNCGPDARRILLEGQDLPPREAPALAV